MIMLPELNLSSPTFGLINSRLLTFIDLFTELSGGIISELVIESCGLQALPTLSCKMQNFRTSRKKKIETLSGHHISVQEREDKS